MTEDCQTVRDEVAASRGQACIFRDGFYINLRAIERRGFFYPEEGPLCLATAWGHGSIGGSIWPGGQGSNWSPYFDEELVRSLEDVALAGAERDDDKQWLRLKSYLDDYYRQLVARVFEVHARSANAAVPRTSSRSETDE